MDVMNMLFGSPEAGCDRDQTRIPITRVGKERIGVAKMSWVGVDSGTEGGQ